jgi:hypothetical protein
MKHTKITLKQIIKEELDSLRDQPRQLKDKNKEMLVVKDGKVHLWIYLYINIIYIRFY